MLEGYGGFITGTPEIDPPLTGTSRHHFYRRNDYIEGIGGDDLLFGEAGIDLLDGGTEDDLLPGGADTEFRGRQGDMFKGDAGSDAPFGSARK